MQISYVNLLKSDPKIDAFFKLIATDYNAFLSDPSDATIICALKTFEMLLGLSNLEHNVKCIKVHIEFLKNVISNGVYDFLLYDSCKHYNSKIKNICTDDDSLEKCEFVVDSYLSSKKQIIDSSELIIVDTLYNFLVQQYNYHIANRKLRKYVSSILDQYMSEYFATFRPITESIKEPVKEPITEPITEPINEPINEPIKETIKDPTIEIAKELVYGFVKNGCEIFDLMILQKEICKILTQKLATQLPINHIIDTHEGVHMISNDKDTPYNLIAQNIGEIKLLKYESQTDEYCTNVLNPAFEICGNKHMSTSDTINTYNKLMDAYEGAYMIANNENCLIIVNNIKTLKNKLKELTSKLATETITNYQPKSEIENVLDLKKLILNKKNRMDEKELEKLTNKLQELECKIFNKQKTIFCENIDRLSNEFIIRKIQKNLVTIGENKNIEEVNNSFTSICNLINVNHAFRLINLEFCQQIYDMFSETKNDWSNKRNNMEKLKARLDSTKSYYTFYTF